MSEEASVEAPAAYAWVVLIVLTMLSGIFSGLNLGLMSLTVEDLNIVINSSTDKEQVKHAKRILPLRRRGNLLLCTLLIGNTVVNVMLSVLTDPIWTYLFGTTTLGTVLGLALPSAIIVVCGEIVPQSVCSRYALSIGARTLPLTYIFVVITFPFALPVSLLLDKVLGDEISGVFTRQGLFELIKLNVESAPHAKSSGLTEADGRLLSGALTFKDRTVGEVMTPLSQVYSLPITAILDEQTFLSILSEGHTRIPVYEGEPTNVVAMLLAKNLLGIGFERKMVLREVLDLFELRGGQKANKVVRVHKDMKLNVALDVCKKKHVHLLVVTEDSLASAASPAEGSADSLRDSISSNGSHRNLAGAGKAVGIATVEDFLEEILQEEIVDETDVYVDNNAGVSGPKLKTVGIVADETPRVARLNSKHFDTTVVLRQLSRASPSSSLGHGAEQS